MSPPAWLHNTHVAFIIAVMWGSSSDLLPLAWSPLVPNLEVGLLPL